MPAGQSDRRKQPLKGAFLTRHLAHPPPCITQQSSPPPTVSSVRRMCRQPRSYSIYPIPLPSPHSSRSELRGDDYIAIWDRERAPVPFTALDINLRPVATMNGAFPFGWTLALKNQDGLPAVDVLDAFRKKRSQYSGQAQSITVRDYYSPRLPLYPVEPPGLTPFSSSAIWCQCPLGLSQDCSEHIGAVTAHIKQQRLRKHKLWPGA